MKDNIEKGNDLGAYISKNILKLDYDDDLLNDWGLYHLHLGTKLDKDNFIERTGPVLFARFDNNYAYFIKVMKHGNWTKQEMVRIIHDNWPESISDFRLNEVESVEPKLTDNDLKKFRKSHIQTLIEIRKGVVYSSIGIGYMSSGISTEVIMICDRYFNTLREYENYIKENIGVIVKDIKSRGIKLGNHLCFILGIQNNIVYAIEGKSLVFIELGQLW